MQGDDDAAGVDGQEDHDGYNTITVVIMARYNRTTTMTKKVQVLHLFYICPSYIQPKTNDCQLLGFKPRSSVLLS